MADVASTLPLWSATAASNGPSGTTAVATGLDDNLREIGKVVRGWLATKGANIASATTTDLGAVEGLSHSITGTTTITSFGTVSAGIWKVVIFAGALTLTHNSTSLILPGGANITTAAGDVAILQSEGSGNWRCWSYVPATGKAVVPSLDITVLTEDTAPDIAADFLATYDTSASTHKKVRPYNMILAPGFIKGIIQSNNVADATNDLDFTAGYCIDATGVKSMVLSALTKRSDAAWAVGTNQGALDTGAVGNSDYYVWAIMRSDTRVTDLLFSLSSTAPTMPSNYDYKRLVGWFKRTAGTIVAFVAYEMYGGGLEYFWSAPLLDIELLNTLTTTRRTDAIRVPLNFSVVATLNVVFSDASIASGIVYCPDQSDLTPAVNALNLANLRNNVAAVDMASQVRVRTSAAGLIASRSNTLTTDTYRVSTQSFEWSRRP